MEEGQFLFDVQPREQRRALLHHRASGQRAEFAQALPGHQCGIGYADLLKDARRRAGHGGRDQNGDGAHALGQVIHHRRQARLALLALAEDPGLGDIDIAVAIADQLPDFAQRQRELKGVHVLFHQRGQGLTMLAQLGVRLLFLAGRGQHAAKVLFDHGHRAADQVAQVVRQIGIDAAQDGFQRAVAIRAKGHFAQQVIAQRVHAIALHNRLGIHHIALGFAHLIVAKEQPAVGEHLLGQWQAQRVQHDGPIDRVEANDVLAHEMHVRRPVFAVERIIVRPVAQGGDIVGERVDPHIDHMLGVEFHGNAPGERRARHAQILQAGAQEVVQHLIGAGNRLNEFRVLLDVIDQPILVFAHAQEIAFFLHQFHGAAAIGAATVHHLRGRPEGFAGRAIQALIFALVDVALVVELLEDLLHDLHMARLGGADVVAVFDVHHLPQVFDARHDFIHELDGRFTHFHGLAFDLLAVLIGAREEKHVVSRLLLKAGHRVRRDGGVRVANVQIAAGIVDGRGDVVRFLLHAFPSKPK